MSIPGLEYTQLPAADVLYYKTLVSGHDDIIISTDTNFIIQTWNAAAEKVSKLTAAEAIGKKITDVLSHGYINTSREEIIKTLLKQNSWKGLVKVLNNDEDTIFLQSSITIIKNVEERIGFVGVSRDVTAEIKANQSLQNFSSVLTLLEESFLIIDRNYNVVFICPKGNVQHFFNSNYKVGDNAFKYVPEVYFDEVKACYEKAFAGKTINQHIESDAAPKLYFNVTYSPLKDDFGNIANVCVIIKDITIQKEIELLQQKKAFVEKSLFESRKLFEDFMENSPLLAWVVDEEGYIYYMNPPYLKAFEFSNEIIGKNIFDIFSEELAGEYFKNNKKVIETKSVVEGIEKGRVPSKMGSYKIVKFPIEYKGKLMIAAWAIDITEQIAIQENLSQLNQNKDKLVSVMAHDVRGPLGINYKFIESILEEYNGLDKETLLGYLKMFKTSVSKCFNLVDELLTWAKVQIAKPGFNPKALNIQAEILKITDSLWDAMRQKNIQLKTNLNYRGEIFADHDMFSIALRNLISNAIKFSYPNETITVETSTDGKKVKVSVRDYGTGIKPELVKKILNKLSYESNFGTAGEKGTGLGLNLAKEYIEKNGGELGIESKEGEGSNFYFTVLLKQQLSLL